MIFKRKAYEELKKWKEKYGKNYVAFLEGPRRVGKSTIAEEFAKNELSLIPIFILQTLSNPP